MWIKKLLLLYGKINQIAKSLSFFLESNGERLLLPFDKSLLKIENADSFT